MEKSKQILMPLFLADNDPWIKRQKVELRKNYKAIYEKSGSESFQWSSFLSIILTFRFDLKY